MKIWNNITKFITSKFIPKQVEIKYETDTPVQGEYRNAALSALEKVKNIHEEERIKMTPERRLLDEREFEYYFEEGTIVKLDNQMFENWDDEFLPSHMRYSQYLNKVGIVKKCHSDFHAFGRGSSYMQDVEFDGMLVKDIGAWLLIKSS